MRRLLFLLLLLGCKDATGVNELKQINRQYAAWRQLGLASYEYTFQQSCFCGSETTQRVKIRVMDEKIVQVFDSAGVELASNMFVFFNTVDQLYVRLVNQAAGGYKFDKLEFDASLHYPVHVSADIPNAVDAGYVFTASGLKAVLQVTTH